MQRDAPAAAVAPRVCASSKSKRLLVEAPDGRSSNGYLPPAPVAAAAGCALEHALQKLSGSIRCDQRVLAVGVGRRSRGVRRGDGENHRGAFVGRAARRRAMRERQLAIGVAVAPWIAAAAGCAASGLPRADCVWCGGDENHRNIVRQRLKMHCPTAAPLAVGAGRAPRPRWTARSFIVASVATARRAAVGDCASAAATRTIATSSDTPLESACRRRRPSPPRLDSPRARRESRLVERERDRSVQREPPVEAVREIGWLESGKHVSGSRELVAVSRLRGRHRRTDP